MAWKKDDVVQLKTGGPRMTVQSDTAEFVECSWFDKNDKLQGGKFAAESLVTPEELPKIEISFAQAKDKS